MNLVLASWQHRHTFLIYLVIIVSTSLATCKVFVQILHLHFNLHKYITSQKSFVNIYFHFIRIQNKGKVSLKIKRETSSGQEQNYLSGIAVNQQFSSKRGAPEKTPIPHGEAELQECVETKDWGYLCKTCNVIAKSHKDIKAHIGGKKHWVQMLLFRLNKDR